MTEDSQSPIRSLSGHSGHFSFCVLLQLDSSESKTVSCPHCKHFLYFSCIGSNGVGSLNDVLRAVRADPVVWPVMQNLLRRYDDCIRAADGLHYKRSEEETAASNGSLGTVEDTSTTSVSSSGTSRFIWPRNNNIALVL